MLELPEVITLSKQVNNALSGKTITQVFNATKPHKFTFYNGNPSEYGKLLVGKKAMLAYHPFIRRIWHVCQFQSFG